MPSGYYPCRPPPMPTRNQGVRIGVERHGDTAHNASMSFAIPRTPWPEHFPDVVIHGELRQRNRHPNLAFAKAGDAGAALALVRDLMSEAALNQIEFLLQGRKPLVVPVTAIEVTGFNAIPDAM